MQDVVIVPANGNIAFTSSNGEVISLQITESAGSPLLVFSGTSSPLFHFSGSSVFVSGLSGSLTQLTDGSPYIEGQGTVTVTTASDGHVIISGTGDGGSGGGGGPDSDWTDNGGNLFTTSSISVENDGFFSGIVTSSAGFTGSLTQLVDGSPYIEGQGTVTVTTASDGHIIISGTGDGGSGGGGSVTQTDPIWSPDVGNSRSSLSDDFRNTGSLDPKWTTWDPNGVFNFITSSEDGFVMTFGGGGVDGGGIIQPAPTGSFMVTARCSFTSNTTTTPIGACGVFLGEDLYNSPDTDPFVNSAMFINGGNSGFARQTWFDYNSFSNEAARITTPGPNSGYVRLAWQSGSSNYYHALHSHDGWSWRIIALSGTIAYLPQTVGLHCFKNGSFTGQGKCQWFDVVTGSFDIIDAVDGRLVTYNAT